MNTDKDHWDEIVNLVKTANGKNPTELDPQRIERIHASVFEHIDSMYPLTEMAVDQPPKHTSSKASIFDKLFDQLRGICEIAAGESRVPAFAVVAVAMISIGLLMKNFVKQAPYFDLPASVVSAELQSHIEPLSNGSRALTATSSKRQLDFMTGVIQAEIDLGGSKNETTTANVVALLSGQFGGNNTPPQSDVMTAFNEQVIDSTNNKDSLAWFTEGYYIELINLSAKHTLDSFKAEPLQSVMEQWRQLGDLRNEVLSSDHLNSNYSSKRQELTTITILPSPDAWQNVVDITHSLKVLAR